MNDLKNAPKAPAVITVTPTPPAAGNPASPARPRTPPREPAGQADWLVTVRHSPLLPGTLPNGKGLIVNADGKADAWQQFLAFAAKRLDECTKQYNRDPGSLQRAHEWLRQAKLEIPAGTEIIGVEYVQGRKAALRVKGTVTIDQVGGYAELASA